MSKTLIYVYLFVLDKVDQLKRNLSRVFFGSPARMASDRATATSSVTERPWEAIERRSMRWLTIETSLSQESLNKCNFQAASPLFQLPKELRDLIFQFACSQSPDSRNEYGETAYYYRPGHTARHKTYTSLLFTCRRVWLEANTLPMQQAEHCFWFQRGPYDPHGDNGWATNIRYERDRCGRFLRYLTLSNLRNLSYIHLFIQMFQAEEYSQAAKLELFFSDYYIQRGLKPKFFQITIRQSDWWDWENNVPLRFDVKWVQAILDAPRIGGVEEFRLELETLKTKLDELKPIVESLKKLEGQPTPVDPGDPNCRIASTFVIDRPLWTEEWSRSSRLDDKDWEVFKNVQTLQLHSTILRWKKKYSDQAPVASLAPSPWATFQTPPGTPFFHVSSRAIFPPSRALQTRSRRALLREVTWSRPTSFPWYKDAMWWYSVEQATKVEEARKDTFERMFADIEAKRFAQLWVETGSLLKFDGIKE